MRQDLTGLSLSQEDAALPPRIVDTSFLSLKTQLKFVKRAKVSKSKFVA